MSTIVELATITVPDREHGWQGSELTSQIIDEGDWRALIISLGFVIGIVGITNYGDFVDGSLAGKRWRFLLNKDRSYIVDYGLALSFDFVDGGLAGLRWVEIWTLIWTGCPDSERSIVLN